jgi:replicative DNA helicase
MKREQKPVTVERILPHDVEAERSVLGAILLDEAAMRDASSVLTPIDFFLSENQAIYSTMLSLQETNRPIDAVLILEELQREGRLVLAGGPAYLTALPDGLPKVVNVPFYVKIVKEKSSLRSLLHAAEAIQGRAMNEAADSRKLADEAIQMFSLIAASAGHSLCVSRKEAAISLLSRLESAVDSKIQSGVKDLDEVIGGYYPGELIVYVAKPGVGKSFLALQSATTCCHAGEHGLYCSGEMPAQQLIARELVSVSGIESYKIRKPSELNQEDFSLLAAAAVNECGTCQILSGNLSIPNIRRSARAMKDSGNLRFIVVDYDELVEVRGMKDEWEAQAFVTGALKSMAMEWLVPVIMISQLRKSLNNEDFPTLDDLYGSGRKAKDASIVIYISRPYVKSLEGDETEAALFVLKSRDGRMGKVDCKFNVKTFRFESRMQTEAEKIFSEPIKSRKKHRADRNAIGEDDDV